MGEARGRRLALNSHIVSNSITWIKLPMSTNNKLRKSIERSYTFGL